MPTQPEEFSPNAVDEQIEQLLLSERSTSASNAVKDLQGLYEQGDTPEQVHRSLERIWSRLAVHISQENQTMPLVPSADSPPIMQDYLRDAQPTSEATPSQIDRKFWRERANRPGDVSAPLLFRQSNKRSMRRTLSLSVLAAIILLGVFSWGLAAYEGSHSQVGSGNPGPATIVPTIPSVSATPAPQSVRIQAQRLLNQFHQEVLAWGRAHQYHDTFNGQTYELDYAYDNQGIGGILSQMVKQASSTADYQQAITQIQNALTNLRAMEHDAIDTTPWTQAHITDSNLLSYYKLEKGTVVVVSLLEQSLRVYQNGRLLKAFQVTTGRYEIPALPGVWQVKQRQAKIVLKSSYAVNSPFWFPPTPVNYALEYHAGGYMLYDSWWRSTYGVGSNFPHRDARGNSFANDGSDGGVNLSTSNMLWLYNHVQLNAPVVIY